jgi:hypothetical protein
MGHPKLFMAGKASVAELTARTGGWRLDLLGDWSIIKWINYTVFGNNRVFRMVVANLLPIPTVKHSIAAAVCVRAHLQSVDLTILASIVSPLAMQTPKKIGAALLFENPVSIVVFAHSAMLPYVES